MNNTVSAQTSKWITEETEIMEILVIKRWCGDEKAMKGDALTLSEKFKWLLLLFSVTQTHNSHETWSKSSSLETSKNCDVKFRGGKRKHAFLSCYLSPSYKYIIILNLFKWKPITLKICEFWITIDINSLMFNITVLVWI